MINDISRYLQAKGTDKPAYCIGLDPAGPGYNGYPEVYTLSKDDCHVVEVLHTNAGDTPYGAINLLHGQFGTHDRCGHCDYWLNGGHMQPKHDGHDGQAEVQEVKTLKLDDSGKASVDTLGVAYAYSHTKAHDFFVQSLSGAAIASSTKCGSGQCGPNVSAANFRKQMTMTETRASVAYAPFACTPSDDSNFLLVSSDSS